MKPAIILSAFMIASGPLPAHAGFFEEAWGVVTDPFKIEAGSQNLIAAVDRAAIHLESIQGKLDASMEARLDQLAEIVRETRTETGIIVQEAFDRLMSLEEQFFDDTAHLVMCTASISEETIKRTLAATLNDLGKRKPRLEVFGFTVLSAEIDSSDILTPIQGFTEARKLYEQRLAAITPEDDYTSITHIYADIARIARDTACFYHENSGTWMELYAAYELENIRLQSYWPYGQNFWRSLQP